MTFPLRLLILPLFLVTLLISSAALAEENGPAAPIDALNATLTEIAAAGGTLSFEERSEKLG
ncbi:MAG: hypothetical protein AAF556_09880, partial [Pseudomonadota bacterium]